MSGKASRKRLKKTDRRIPVASGFAAIGCIFLFGEDFPHGFERHHQRHGLQRRFDEAA